MSKLQAIWNLIRNRNYLLVTPSKVIATMPKGKQNFELMHEIVAKLNAEEVKKKARK